MPQRSGKEKRRATMGGVASRLLIRHQTPFPANRPADRCAVLPHRSVIRNSEAGFG